MRVDQQQTTADPHPIEAPERPEPGAKKLNFASPAGPLPGWSSLRPVLADLGVLAIAVAITGRGSGFGLVVSVSVVLCLRMAGLYQRVLVPTALNDAGRLAVSAAAGSLAAASTTSTTSSQAFAFTMVAVPALLAGRSAAYASERRTVTRRPEAAVVVGTGAAGQELVTRLLEHPEYGFSPVGFLDSKPSPLDPNLSVSVLGTLSALSDVVARFAVRRVFLDANSVTEHELVDVLDLVADLQLEISVLPVLVPRLSTSLVVEEVAGSTVLSYRPSRHQGITWGIKRMLDVVGSLAMLMASAPIWLVTAAAIKLDSPGPVLFKQVRVGRHGRPFMIYKFRSMETDAEAQKTLYLDLNAAEGPYFKLERDPRVTRVGRIIRRYSIDEIPQLVNVLCGDMSLVGPRPALECEVAEYPDWFRRRLAVRPGLSGLWQVSGRFLVPFAEATRLDVSYVDNWSLGLDLQILARTPAVVLSGRGAR